MVEVVTLPAAARILHETRPRLERIITQYQDRLPPVARVGITRVWPAELIPALRLILQEEDRIASGPFA